MNFCNVCDNMYYFKISEDETNTLKHFCRKCGNTDDKIFNNSENICISKTHIKKKQNTYNSIINEYTKLDPTLPRTKTSTHVGPEQKLRFHKYNLQTPNVMTTYYNIY